MFFDANVLVFSSKKKQLRYAGYSEDARSKKW
jgi:hypothetical protein